MVKATVRLFHSTDSPSERRIRYEVAKANHAFAVLFKTGKHKTTFIRHITSESDLLEADGCMCK